MTIHLFPGQGSQFQGMGKAWAESHPIIAQTLEEGSEILRRPLAQLCWETPDAELSRTDNAQVALFALSMGVHRALTAKNGQPGAVAGFSLGECTALCAAGVLSFEQAIKMVQKRGELMQKTAGSNRGGMSAVLGLDAAEVIRICEETEGFVTAVNFNCPGQTVIAGSLDTLPVAEENMLKSGASRVVRLSTPGAFHTVHLEQAAREFAEYVSGLTVNPICVTIYANQTGKKITGGFDLAQHLALQMKSPVMWENIVRNALSDGYTKLIECGPGNTLSGFVKRIDKTVKVISTENALAF